jgi:WD40 repeat protein
VKLLEPVLQHQDVVIAVAFSPDGQTVLTGSWDGTARLWATVTGQALGPPLVHHGVVNQVAFHPGGHMVLTASSDWTARLWDVATSRPLGPPLQHDGAVTRASFSPDGDSILTGSDDGTARLWRLRPPLDMNTDQIPLWLSVVTGLELDHSDDIQVLDAATWQERQRKLKER